MSIYDISGYAVRIILNSDWYDRPSAQTPLFVEGTVLQVMTHGRVGDNLYNQGRLLELIGNSYYEGEADIYVRFDNDVKTWLVGGTVLLRSAKYGRMKSIWPGVNDVVFNETPYHMLCPRTHYKKPESIWMTAPKQGYKTFKMPEPTANVTYQLDGDGTISYTDENGNTAIISNGEPGIISAGGGGKTKLAQAFEANADIVVNAEVPPDPHIGQWQHHTITRTGTIEEAVASIPVNAEIDLPDPDEQFNAEYGNVDDEIPY